MQIEGASRTSKSEMRLWKATAESELLFTEDGGQLLKAPSQHTFRLKLLVAHDSLSVDDIISCIATTLNISDPVTSDWASIIASIGCSTASGLATVLTVISCFTIPDLGPGIVFGTIGCVNGAAQLISCGYLNCSSSTFSLTAAPISAIITQGQNATFTITSTFSGAFPGPVSNFSVSNLPSGASFSFSPTSISSSGGTTSLTIATTGQVALGDRALTVTGSGAGGLTASVAIELNINPSSSSTIIPYSDAITSKVDPGNSCSNPPASNSFLASDETVYLYFFATTTLNDNITSDWLAPDGTVFTGGHWSPPVFGNYCYLGESQSIENLPPSQIGSWLARVYDNGSIQFTVPFTVSSSGGTLGAGAPYIAAVTPTTSPVGVNTTFTLNGSGFQQGFSGLLWVGNNSFPLNPGAQTVFASSTEVELVVEIGATTDPTTSFCLQVTNPDGTASNKFCGLTAQGGGVSMGNLQIGFSPNPVPLVNGEWSYRVTVTETNGVAVTLTGLTVGGVDYTSYISQWFTVSTTTIPAYGQISASLTTQGGSGGSLSWTLSSGANSWSKTVTLSP